MNRKETMLALGVLICLGCAEAQAGAADNEPAPLIAHEAVVVFDVDGHKVEIVDHMVVPAGLEFLRLNAALKIVDMMATDGGRPDPQVVVEESTDDDGPYQKIHVSRMGLRNGGDLILKYEGTFYAPVDNVVFSRENVGSEIRATISDEGIYLSSASDWLAGHEDAMGTYDLRIDTPEGFETVTQGRNRKYETVAGRLHTHWVAPDPSDGIDLIANRFFVHTESIRNGLEASTYLLEDDAALRATYLERTRAYIAMYEEMIGPYPYSKFATVENWFPTGYGMPSFTLLGGQVLRLPFIPYTSFGHEIAHNWWGNSVFVDPNEGNWCEGLTVWCADYHYKELESADAARDYRRTLLKDYAAYAADPTKDFPLSAFRSRHSGATRAVGYGKSMMVFHMLDRAIGREAFLKALRAVAADHRFKAAAWSDFLTAFGVDASWGVQWLERTGAPTLRLADVRFKDKSVTFRLAQGEPAYTLDVPVVVTAAGVDVEHIVRLATGEASFELPANGATRLAVDPDCHLFRHLDAAEIEPTISQILGADKPAFVVDLQAAPAGAMSRAAQEFAQLFAEDDAAVVDGVLPTAGRAAIVINPGPELLKRYEVPGLTVTGRQAFMDGKRYDLEATDLVFAAAAPGRPGCSDLVVLCGAPERLAGLASRISHYGKYSWLALPAGQGRPERGNWSPGASPLLAVR